MQECSMGAIAGICAEIGTKQALTEVIHQYARGLDRMDCQLALSGGRYLDRFQCIDGVRAIRHRQSISEWNRVEPVVFTQAAFGDRPLITPNNPEVASTLPKRDHTDFSYSLLRST